MNEIKIIFVIKKQLASGVFMYLSDSISFEWSALVKDAYSFENYNSAIKYITDFLAKGYYSI